MEIDYSDIFHYLSNEYFPLCSNLVDKGYYLNFRTGTNNYFKSVWFDFNGDNKLIIRTPDHRYRNIYLSKIRSVKVCFINDFYHRNLVQTDEDILKSYGVDFKVKIEDLYSIFRAFKFRLHSFKKPDLLRISTFMDGKQYNFVMEESADFLYGFRDNLKGWYLALTSIINILEKYRSLNISDFNGVLKKEFPFSNKITLCTEFD